jgi:hypothetical protein
VKPFFVQRHQLTEIWHKVEPFISAACAYNNHRYQAMDYLKDLIEGSRQLWLVMDAEVIKGIVATRIAHYPLKKCCVIDMCTGDALSEWIHMTALVEEWGKQNGCQQMLLFARPGMERALKPQNYTKTHVVLEKDL